MVNSKVNTLLRTEFHARTVYGQHQNKWTPKVNIILDNRMAVIVMHVNSNDTILRLSEYKCFVQNG